MISMLTQAPLSPPRIINLRGTPCPHPYVPMIDWGLPDCQSFDDHGVCNVCSLSSLP